MATIVLASYVVAGLVVGCRIGTALAWHFAQAAAAERSRYRLLYSEAERHLRSPDLAQWLGAMATAMLAAAPVWPFVLVAVLGRRWLFAPPQSVRVEQQAQRIAELERELELP